VQGKWQGVRCGAFRAALVRGRAGEGAFARSLKVAALNALKMATGIKRYDIVIELFFRVLFQMQRVQMGNIGWISFEILMLEL
jgi:hypothetical protein